MTSLSCPLNRKPNIIDMIVNFHLSCHVDCSVMNKFQYFLFAIVDEIKQIPVTWTRCFIRSIVVTCVDKKFSEQLFFFSQLSEFLLIWWTSLYLYVDFASLLDCWNLTLWKIICLSAACEHIPCPVPISDIQKQRSKIIETDTDLDKFFCSMSLVSWF